MVLVYGLVGLIDPDERFEFGSDLLELADAAGTASFPRPAFHDPFGLQ
jgi:hypothetical protein